MFFFKFKYVMQTTVESYKHPQSPSFLTPTSFVWAPWSCSLQQCFQVVTVRMFTSVTRALSGPISILMTGMYSLDNIQSVLCTRGPSLLRTHLVSSDPCQSYKPGLKKKKKRKKISISSCLLSPRGFSTEQIYCPSL